MHPLVILGGVALLAWLFGDNTKNTPADRPKRKSPAKRKPTDSEPDESDESPEPVAASQPDPTPEPIAVPTESPPASA